MSDVRPALRVPLLVLGFIALAIGIGAGLVRLGWNLPIAPSVIALHGMLMVSGFFGTVIALERAVAIGARWAYAGPLLSGGGALALVLGARFAPFAFIGAGAVFVVASLVAFAKQRAIHTGTLALGAATWLGSSVLAAAGAAPMTLVPWWFGFFVLTIAGERLELSRVLGPRPGATRLFIAAIAIVLAGIASSSLRLFGVGLVAVAAWLALNDVARRTIRGRGLPRFAAFCLLAGYAWLLAGGALFALARGIGPGSFAWDAAIHALAIGFVFSMVLGHAPIIVPAVLRRPVPYHPAFYGPLVLLHASLALRVIGDAQMQMGPRSAGGLANAVAIAAFIVVTAISATRANRLQVLGAIGALFGLVTLFEGGSVLFVDGEARRAAGHYVPFVLWLNFLGGFAYVASGIGLVLGKRWASWLAAGIALVTALGFLAFGAHVLSGGAFERRTVIAMTIRTLFWTFVAGVALRKSARDTLHFVPTKS